MHNVMVVAGGLVVGGAIFVINCAVKSWLDAQIDRQTIAGQKNGTFMGMPANELRNVSSVMEKYSWLILLVLCSATGLLAYSEFGV